MLHIGQTSSPTPESMTDLVREPSAAELLILGDAELVQVSGGGHHLEGDE